MVKVNNTKTATPEKAPREASLFLDSLNSYKSRKKNVTSSHIYVSVSYTHLTLPTNREV